MAAFRSLKEGEHMKELYNEAELEIVRMEAMDIITTSNGGSLDDDELPPIIVQ